MQKYYNPYIEYLKEERLELTEDNSIKGYHLLFYYLHPRDEYICPICESKNIIKYGIKTRKIKGSIFQLEKTIINIKLHRMLCKNCNTMFNDSFSDIKKGSNILFSTKMQIMIMLKDRVTFEYVANTLNISADSVIEIFDSLYEGKRYKLSSTLCFDEIKNISNALGNYAFVILDPINETLIDILEDRRSKRLEDYFYSISFEERSQVKYIVTDMYEPYRTVVKTYFRNAIQVIDEFHFVRYMTNAMESVRIRIMNSYNIQAKEHRILKKYSDLLLMRKSKIKSSFYSYNHFRGKKTNVYSILDDCLNLSEELIEGYTLLQKFYNLIDYTRYEEVRKIFDKFIIKLLNSNIKEFNSVGKTYINWEDEIINSFIKFGDKRLSNGPIEGMNSYLKEIVRISHGFKSFDLFRKRLMYTMNKDVKIKG